MNVACTYCATHFTHVASEGRPPSFCSDQCREDARTDPKRICRGCGNTYDKQFMKYPTFCSEECHNAERTTCLQCGGPTPVGSRFCSAGCLATHQSGRTCSRCGGPVDPPDHAPYNRMPRFCSELCRSNVASESGHLRYRTQAEALRLTQLLDYTPEPIWKLPHKTDYVPFLIPQDLVPPLAKYKVTAKVRNSIAWWNFALPRIVSTARQHDFPAWVPVSYLGRVSFGGISTPTGILPLYECLPWVTEEALIGVDLDNVIGMWKVAAANRPHREREIARRMERIREWLVEYDEGKWIRDPVRKNFFQASESGSSKFVQSLVKWQAMHTPPSIEAVYLPNQAEYLNSERFIKARMALDNLRVRRTLWQECDYKIDPPMPPDRTLDAIERIMDAERRRLSR